MKNEMNLTNKVFRLNTISNRILVAILAKYQLIQIELIHYDLERSPIYPEFDNFIIGVTTRKVRLLM